MTLNLAPELGRRGITINAIAFLVSDDAGYLTGRTLAADGGYF